MLNYQSETEGLRQWPDKRQVENISSICMQITKMFIQRAAHICIDLTVSTLEIYEYTSIYLNSEWIDSILEGK